ncbi:Quinolinate phosphoribosyl transferase [Pseudomassariella vexata]|uniref:nicotinate phosphoribosyltransferase n=1 Tax=Pseudomassariella vexata TaxID=1141098 RepID=A0A1Y2EF41_9PEZI|nr:Quinolinate phosphoribosyl transferase [Pseudomassariella vexata]ORY70192.1 Quinolinate phosphoribosyl transferase [Pseudomassariella vexata]
MDFNSSDPSPEGVISFLDTDLYKLTMQCAVFKYYRDVPVTYAFTNRTPEKRFSRKAFTWLSDQISKLGNISLSDEEYHFLQTKCVDGNGKPYLNPAYLEFLKDFRLSPREQVVATWEAVGKDTGADSDLGSTDIQIRGRWVDTILYEIPILALASEAYFRFMDTDWNYENQFDNAKEKGVNLLQAGCKISEFGTRRRRDYHTQYLVIKGLKDAVDQGVKEATAKGDGSKAKEGTDKNGWTGKFLGTSNVHLAMRLDLAPIGTVAHEWFMGIAAITNDYEGASEEALKRWIGCFGEGVLGIALTDTFGTPAFLKAFAKPVKYLPDTPNIPPASEGTVPNKTYADVFQGVRQDSGDPATFVGLMREFYDGAGIKDEKTIVFSDSLNNENCLEYKKVSEDAGFQTTFGIGTFFSNDFKSLTTGQKSTPLNIVIKLSSAGGNPAIKISDNVGKNTGDKAKVVEVKKQLGYIEKNWKEGDETARWGN